MAFTVDIRGNASHLEKTIGLAKGRLMDLGNAAKFGVTALAGLGAAGAAGVGALVVSSSQAAMNMESLTMQFEVLTGSAEEAASLMRTFRDEAVKSPLSAKDYADAAQGFMSYGLAAKDVLPTLKMVGDVSMGNSKKFELLSYAMAQVFSNKTLKGDDLRQFVAQGFNPLAVISERTGKSMEVLREEMEKHQITYAMVEQSLKDVTSEGGRFYKAIEKGADTTEGKMAKVKDSILSLQIALGTGFNEGLKDALDASNNFLPQIESKFTEAGQIIGGAISQAVEGNSEQLAAVGAYMGEVVFNGFKSFYMKAMDELVAGAQNAFAVGTEQFRALAIKGELMGVGEAAGNVVRKGNVSESASMASYIQSALDESASSGTLKTLRDANAQKQTAIEEAKLKQATKEGVKEGMKEVWYSLETGAKFSN